MRKLLLQVQMSVDGYMADKNGNTDWMVWNWGDEWNGRTPLTGGKGRGLEEASVHWHTVVYANKHRAEGRVETILPEYGVFCKRPTRAGQYCHP